mmetsp:Transcript_21233/g.32062  ORF Transcript_21233/g.32062 Transcript_21233/m.32062 type:complete len:85 (+) Transcript_21233:1935-2189(+)
MNHILVPHAKDVDVKIPVSVMLRDMKTGTVLITQDQIHDDSEFDNEGDGCVFVTSDEPYHDETSYTTMTIMRMKKTVYQIMESY